MANIDYNGIWQQIAQLAKNQIQTYAQQAQQDGKDFVNKAKTKFETYVGQLATDPQYTQDMFEDDVLDLAALADMDRLKQTIILKANIDKFTSGVVDILVKAGLAAIG